MEILSGFGILAGYLFLRLTNLLSLPIFTDEEIYVRWTQIAKGDATWRFISLTDGKQPMFVWWNILFMHIVRDPLLSSRLVSVVAGSLTVIGLFFLGKEIFKNKCIGILSSALYVFYPFALVYDRMALYDSMVGMFTVWALYFSVLLAKTPRAWTAFVLALVMGGGMLTKTSAFFSMYLLPATLLLFDFKSKDVAKRLWRWVGFALLAVVLANVYYSVLRLSPFFHIIGDKNATFVYTFSEWMQHPFTFLFGNLLGVWDWLHTYMTWPVLILLIGGFVVKRSFFKEKLLLFTYFVVPFFLLALFGKVLYPRFIFFMTLPLLLIVGLFIVWLYERLKNKLLFVVLLFISFAWWMYTDYFILANFAKAPIPLSDLTQYSNDWPAGGGVKEMVAFFKEQASKGKIYIATEGTFGSVPTLGLEIYLDGNKNIEKRGIWPVPETVPADLLEKAKSMPVFFVFNNTQGPLKPAWVSHVKLLQQYKKGTGDAYMRIYQIIP